MKVKTYKNQSLQEGLEDIKRDLGSDALILSTRSISERPRFGLFKRQAWEITAVLDEKEKAKRNEDEKGQSSPSGRGQIAEGDRVRAVATGASDTRPVYGDTIKISPHRPSPAAPRTAAPPPSSSLDVSPYRTHPAGLDASAYRAHPAGLDASPYQAGPAGGRGLTTVATATAVAPVGTAAWTI